MMSHNTRVEKLERRAGAGDVPVIVMVWSDDDILDVNGEQMTAAEFKARYPDALQVDWPDDELETG